MQIYMQNISNNAYLNYNIINENVLEKKQYNIHQGAGAKVKHNKTAGQANAKMN